MSASLPERLTSALADRYVIEREIGAGGMATVYLAADLKHDRKVALKVLKPELAAVVGAERFIAEIRTTANLQHPHILPLFDSGEADGFLWYAMPWVQGESLRERIDREKQLPVGEAVAIARKVLGALGAAHDAGIVHRDIKPANILMDARGEPLVADFGIALAVQEAGGGRLTETGLSVGTPYYMSPEQATGDREPDARADLYSLGCVLYEMLTGEPPFQGTTAQAVLGRILTGAVARPTEIRASIPANVEAAVLTALEKLPADRFGAAGDFARALDDVAYRRAGASSGAAETRGGRLRTALGVAVTAAVVLPLGFAMGRSGGDRAAASGGPVVVSMIPGQTNDAHPPRITSSGIVFVHGSEGWTRRFPGEETGTPIPGNSHLVFSRDERTLFFKDSTGAWVSTPTEGGPATPTGIVVGFPQPRFYHGAASDREGRLYVSPRNGSRRVFRSGPGAEVDTLTLPSDRRYMVSDVLPDGRLLMMVLESPRGSMDTWLVDPESGEERLLVEDATGTRYDPNGYLVYSDASGGIFAVAFDPAADGLAGAAVRISTAAPPRWERAAHALNPSGHLTLLRNTRDEVVGREGGGVWALVDLRSGAVESTGVPIPRRTFPAAGISPDGGRLAFRSDGDERIRDLRSGSEIPLPFDGGTVRYFSWSPDGDSVMVVTEEGSVAIFDAEDPSLVRRFDSPITPFEWFSPHQVLGTRSDSVGDENLYRMDLRTLEVEPLIRTPAIDVSPSLSPDRRWIAYVSGEGEARGLYVNRWPELTGRIRLAGVANYFSFPAWSADGRSVHILADAPAGGRFLDGGHLEDDDTWSPGAVFDTPARLGNTKGTTRDGRVLIQVGPEVPDDIPPPEAVAISNWVGLLERGGEGR